MMRLKLLIILTICMLPSSEQAIQPSSVTLALAQGIALTTLVNWLTDHMNTNETATPAERKFEKGTVTVFLRAAIDPFFEQELINRMFPFYDPRRYILLGMFQAGRFAPKAMDFLTQLGSNIAAKWVSKQTEVKSIPVFKGDDLAEWVSPDEAMCPAEEESALWKTIFKHEAMIKDMAISCSVGYIIYYLTNKLLGAAQLDANALGVKLLAQELGVAGGTYLIEWARNLVNDVSKVEELPFVKTLSPLVLMQGLSSSIDTLA